MQRILNTAVIGAGHIGSFHAQKYAALPRNRLVAIVDVCGDKAKKLAKHYACAAYTQLAEITTPIDAVSIATPATTHFAIAQQCLSRNWHCLIEKPICCCEEEAAKLTACANSRKLVLQIGHSERLNPVYQAIKSLSTAPRFITCERLSPFSERALDTSVVLDVMIHDLDLILQLIDASLSQVQRCSAPVLSDQIDIAHAYLTFANGSTVSVTASRVSTRRQRAWRLFERDFYVSADFDGGILEVHCAAEKQGALVAKGFNGSWEMRSDGIYWARQQFSDVDMIKAEISAFLDAILYGKAVPVDSESGHRALALAQKIHAA